MDWQIYYWQHFFALRTYLILNYFLYLYTYMIDYYLIYLDLSYELIFDSSIEGLNKVSPIVENL